MKNQNQSGLKNFKPKINLNHNIYLLVSREQTCGEFNGLLTWQPVSIRSDGVCLQTFSTPVATPLWCVFTKSLTNRLTLSPMESWQGNPSPSDPMESVCRHFPPQPQYHFDAYLLRLSWTDLRWVRWSLDTATRLHRIRWSPFADSFHPSHKNFDVYLLSLLQTDFWWVCLMMAFVDRTQFGCIGQPSNTMKGLANNCLL